ncbi:tpr domain protein [Diplodia corticola]|uniref:Tpr domain protein n=1 Tax=Diplodia corticola TaxID=236234 RepID=A0A1J9QUW2_9PEZI|nr:tpr domain protein [Diplodia corticola]OJD32774.1 tpr domain protein [Diplodia corticola]
MGSTGDDYYDLGSFHRGVTTRNPTAQKWFDRGLVWCYGFNHEEAARCFESVIENDPDCSMGYWGLAYALGPNYNKPWELFDEKDLETSLRRVHDAVHKAQEHAAKATPFEQAVAHAIQFRNPKDVADKDYSRYNRAYADAMEAVYRQFPDDLDAVTLYADALMNLTPWELWDLRTGKPMPGSRAVEVKTVLDRALADHEQQAHEHPGLLHMYIHMIEMSHTPELGITLADRLRDLIPDAGHLRHMPSHLDILIGDYRRAIASNAAAAEADEKYYAREGGMNFYTLYRLHDYHSLVYAAMFNGQSRAALDTVAKMEEHLPASLLSVDSPPMADWLESFLSARLHVLVRFGRWHDILALPLPADPHLYCVTTAMTHYAKGIAYAVTADIPRASEQRALLRAAVSRVPDTRMEYPNRASDILAIAVAMLDGELEYRKENYDDAFAHLRKAVELDDSLNYAEPWAWMQPTRHALAALLLEQGRVQEAADAYAADLGFDDTLPRARQHPNNVWALHGYHECLARLGGRDHEQTRKIVEQQLRLALAVADVEVTASCYCRRGRGEGEGSTKASCGGC